MEIRWSSEFGRYRGEQDIEQLVLDKVWPFKIANPRWNGMHYRFVLDADERAHDRVIRALLTLDPDATVRTARAIYEGLADFEKQRGKA